MSEKDDETKKMNLETQLKNVKSEQIMKEKKISEILAEIETIKYSLNSMTKRQNKRKSLLRDEWNELSKLREDEKYKIGFVKEVKKEISEIFLRTIDKSEIILKCKNDANFQKTMQKHNESILSSIETMDIMQLLDIFGANVSIMLSFRQSFEEEMNEKIRNHENLAKLLIYDFEKRIKSKEKEKKMYQNSLELSTEKKKTAENSIKEIIDDSSTKMRRLQKENERIITEIMFNEEMINFLFSKLDEREKELRKREIQKNRIKELESLILNTVHKHRYEKNKLKSEIFQAFTNLERRTKFFNLVETENKRIKLKINKIEEEIKDTYQFVNRKEVLKLQKIQDELIKTNKIVEKKKKEVQDNHHFLATRISSMQKQNLKLQKSIKKLTKINTNLKKRPKSASIKGMKNSETNAFNFFDLDGIKTKFKRKLKKENRKIRKLKKKIGDLVLKNPQKKLQREKEAMSAERKRIKMEKKIENLEMQEFELFSTLIKNKSTN